MNEFDLSDAVELARFIAWLAECADRAHWPEKCVVRLPRSVGTRLLLITADRHKEEPEST